MWLHNIEIQKCLEAADIAIANLIDARDALGLQLSNALGSLGGEEFDKALEPYMKQADISDQDLYYLTAALVRFLGAKIDTEIISTAFRVTLDQASKALSLVVAQIDSGKNMFELPEVLK